MGRIGTDMATRRITRVVNQGLVTFSKNNGHPRKSHALRTIAPQICEFNENLRRELAPCYLLFLTGITLFRRVIGRGRGTVSTWLNEV
jgi:hypothetical protein